MKNARKMKNGPGRNNSMGGRVEKSKGFMPNSFDRVLLDAPCSALGLRPRLFAGEVRFFLDLLHLYPCKNLVTYITLWFVQVMNDILHVGRKHWNH